MNIEEFKEVYDGMPRSEVDYALLIMEYLDPAHPLYDVAEDFYDAYESFMDEFSNSGLEFG